MFKAVIFDIGQTLVEYNKPLNWSSLYRPALEYVADQCKYKLSERQYEMAIEVLSKYNTRINPRDYEVSSDAIFSEIMCLLDLPLNQLSGVKYHFYSFFKRESRLFSDVEETLSILANRQIIMGALTDVAYGMDNEYALEDISAIKKYIAYPITSIDVGYRKPRIDGLVLLAEKMKVNPSEIVYVGDEEKDMLCANNAGVFSVLINRGEEIKHYGQKKQIKSLMELLEIVM